MDFNVGNVLSSKQWLNICIGVLVVAILRVSGEITLDNGDSDESGEMGNTEFKTLWDLYLLPRLEHHRNNQFSQLSDAEDTQNSVYSENDNLENYLPKTRTKRLGVAGLDNLDLMTKTLDRAHMRHRNRFQLPMSVNNMSSNRLRMLMAAQGKRK